MTSASKIEKIEWDEEAAERAAEEASRAAVEHGLNDILDEAKRNVPFATGTLSESGKVDLSDDGFEGAVSFDTPYAHILRSHPEWEYNWGRSGRWLDDAVSSSSGSVGKSMEDGARSAWPNY